MLAANGNILLQQGWTKIVEVTPDKKSVWEYDAAKMNGNAGKPVEVHAFQRLGNDLTMIVESGPARIIEVDREGRGHAEIKLRVNRPAPTVIPDWPASWPAEITLSLTRPMAPSANTIPKGRWSGDEVPLFGQEKEGGRGPEAFRNSVFSATRLPNGNTLIGAGNGHSVLEVNPAKEIVWKIANTSLPAITLAWVTRVVRLPERKHAHRKLSRRTGEPAVHRSDAGEEGGLDVPDCAFRKFHAGGGGSLTSERIMRPRSVIALSGIWMAVASGALATTDKEFRITAEDRAHWAFQPVRLDCQPRRSRQSGGPVHKSWRRKA